MRETIKYLWKEANKKKNGEETDIKWYISEGTSGTKYFWSRENNVTCYIYVNKNGKYSRPTFSLITKKHPFGTCEVNYQSALQLAE